MRRIKLCIILLLFRAKGKKLYLGFLDLEKAFDRVPRKVIRWAMCKLGDEERLVSAVMSMYNGAKTVVRTVYGNSTTSFSFLTGQVSLRCNILLRTNLLYNLPLTVNDISLLVSNG